MISPGELLLCRGTDPPELNPEARPGGAGEGGGWRGRGGKVERWAFVGNSDLPRDSKLSE